MHCSEVINSIDMEDIACPLGCPRNDEVVLTSRDMLHDLPGAFTILKCRQCSLMRTNPRPTLSTVGFYYPDNYGPYLGNRVRQPGRASSVKKLLKPLVKKCFNFNTTLVPPLTPGRLLEVGCASGAFLHHMAGQGWQVEGIEFSKKPAEAAAARGYAVYAGPLESAPSPSEPFDLIVGWMVLEHLHDPLVGLRKLCTWAKPGSWLVLSVPNAGSLEFSFFKENWYSLDVPRHLYHFTPETLRHILQASGWSLERIYHQRVLNDLVASIGYVLRNRGYARLGGKLIDFPDRDSKLHFALYPLAWCLSIFGQTGRMTVWARKI